MAAQKALIARPWSQDAIDAFQPCCDVDPCGALLSPLELLHESYLHEFEHREQRALVAIKRFVTSGGCRVHVQGLVNDGPAPLQLRTLLTQIEATAIKYGASVMSMQTPHPALVKASVRLGGYVNAANVIKFLGRQ
jgi:hypothetical protein